MVFFWGVGLNHLVTLPIIRPPLHFLLNHHLLTLLPLDPPPPPAAVCPPPKADVCPPPPSPSSPSFFFFSCPSDVFHPCAPGCHSNRRLTTRRYEHLEAERLELALVGLKLEVLQVLEVW